MKAAIIIDCMVKNGLMAPTRKQLKFYGHDLLQLYESCVQISLAESRKIPRFDEMEIISRSIFNLLNDFAKVTRYHNLDALSLSNPEKDPLLQWNRILLEILETDVSEKAKAKIMRIGMAVSDVISDRTVTIMQGLDKQALSTAQALILPGLHDPAARHAVLYLVKALCPVRDLLSDLSHKAYGLGTSVPPFPQMHEFLEWLWDDRSYVLRKKR
ncbi:MAG: hypothetical protein QM766_07095 [Burkholderiaceae bacterium]